MERSPQLAGIIGAGVGLLVFIVLALLVVVFIVRIIYKYQRYKTIGSGEFHGVAIEETPLTGVPLSNLFISHESALLNSNAVQF